MAATSISTVNRVRFAGLDFDTFEDEILSRLQVNFGAVYNDFVVSSLGIMLVDVVSFGLETLAFYLDRRATDNYLQTARTRSSVSKLTRQIGYKMSAAVAGSVDLSISLGQRYSFPVLMPLGFQMRNDAGLIFECQQPTTWTTFDQTAKAITFAEGETKSSTFVSDGTPNQVFKLKNVPDGKFIVGPGRDGVSKVAVTVNGQTWNETTTGFLTFGTDNVFEVGYNDAPPTLRFGDGIAGNIPALGTSIVISYFATSGVNGSATAGTITTPVTSLVVAFQTIALVATNPEGTSGGSDPESIEKAKAIAPSFFAARGVNITQGDYQSRSSAFTDSVLGAIASAQALSPRSATNDAFLNSKLASIRGDVQAILPTINTAVTAATAELIGTGGACGDTPSTLSISKLVGCIQTADATLVSSLTDIGTQSASGSTQCNTGKLAALTAQGDASGINSDLASMNSTITAITVGGSDQLTSATKNALLALITRMTARASDATAQSGAASTAFDAIKAILNTITLDEVSATANRATILADATAIGTHATNVNTTVVALNTSVPDISTTVTNLTLDIFNHVDAFLSSDCSANLVEVPVLALDSDGFYVPPTIGLQNALQDYLNQNKEVTQSIKVTGASNVLVMANITASVGVLRGYVESTVQAQVEAAILGVLRQRPFGKTLFLSELYGVTAPESGAIAGISWINIDITGPVDHLDSSGNLVAAEFEVVTRGTLVVSTVPVSQ